MLLSCRVLQNAVNVNVFEVAQNLRLTEGDTPSVYLQLVDLSVDRRDEGFSPPGRRYMPAAAATLQVTLDNVDDAKKYVRNATQPFSQDPSIWKFDILTTDVLKGTINLRLALTEGTKVTRGNVKAVLLVCPASGV